MGKQFIISISREYGSGGHEIGRELAAKLGFTFYDHNLLDEIAEKKGLDVAKLNKYDETPHRGMLNHRISGYNASPEEAVAEMQFEHLREKASSGESFVIVGRCSESVLADCRGLISIFISGDEVEKINRIMVRRGMDANSAFMTMRRHDSKRKNYHNHFCETSWGDSRAYDLCVNSSVLGIDGTIDFLYDFVQRRMAL